MDRLQSMKIFACVVESGGFMAAAEQLGLSQAQVTRHVAALESELGLRLLERTTRRMRLTEIGEAYLERCRRILALVEEADAIGEAHRGEPRGVLRLTAAASFARVHLAPAIAEYMQQYPETAFELILSDRTLNMVDEGIDLAFRITQAVDPGLVARRLAPCRVVVCAAPAYLARRGKPLKPSDLSDHDCLSHSYFARSAWPFAAPAANRPSPYAHGSQVMSISCTRWCGQAPDRASALLSRRRRYPCRGAGGPARG